MSQKHRLAKKARAESKDQPKDKAGPSATALILRKRRNKRLMILGAMALVIPVLEVIAYHYRAITITIVNKSPAPLTALKFTYPGGDFAAAEIRPEESISRVIRPDFSFSRADFSTYRPGLVFQTPDAHYRQFFKISTLDYSCTENFAITPSPETGRAEVKQRTSPGFPLSAIRDLLARLGIG